VTVSQGSTAMSLKCGGIRTDHFVANFVPSLEVKEFGKSLKFSTQVGGLVFLTRIIYYYY